MSNKAVFFKKKNTKRTGAGRWARVGLWGILVLSVLPALFFVGKILLSRLSIFSLQKIHIIGSPKTLGEEEILRRAGVQTGANLFRLDLGEIQRRLQGHDFFKSVEVQRRLPKDLLIKIRENFPEFILNTGRMYYVDGEGEIFRDITETRDERDFPILSGVSEEDLHGEPLQVQRMVKLAVELKKSFEGVAFFQEMGLSEIHFDKNIGFTLYPEKQKYSIKFGNEDFGRKMEMLTQVWVQLQKTDRKISSIDLNYPGKVLMTL